MWIFVVISLLTGQIEIMEENFTSEENCQRRLDKMIVNDHYKKVCIRDLRVKQQPNKGERRNGT